MTSVAFDSYSAYYDLLYRDKDYAGEVAYVEKLLKQAQPRTQSILELGCGTGIHASMLADKGYTVHGIDLSRTMLVEAEKRKQKLSRDCAGRMSFSDGDVRNYRINKQFDAVVSLFHVASYQTSNQDIADLLTTAYQHLNQGGIFVFDFWYGPAVLTDRPAKRFKQLENETIKVERTAAPDLFPNDNSVDVNYSIRVTEKATKHVDEIKETHRMRYFFLPEMDFLLRRHGFRSWKAEEWMTGRTPDFSTWGVCITAQK